MKHFSAILTALVITAIIGLGVGVVGVSAIANTNTVPIQDTRNATAGSITSNSGAVGNPATADVQQLQQEVSNLQSQLGQASQIIQQYQSILVQLQRAGVIQVDQSGNIYLSRGNQFGDDNN